jgi:hypothetical protein
LLTELARGSDRSLILRESVRWGEEEEKGTSDEWSQ